MNPAPLFWVKRGLMGTNEPIVDLQITVARMEGMLSQALSDQGNRILNAETNIGAINTRIGATSEIVSTHGEKIVNVERDINEIKDKQNSFWAKLWPPLALIVTALALLWNVFGK